MIKIMRFAIICLIIIFGVNFFGFQYDLYDFWWFDTLLHYLGGFFVALLFFHYLKKHFLPNSKLQNILILVGAVMFIGVVWEFFEYILNQTAREAFHNAFKVRLNFMGDMNDTMIDLLMDMLGGFTVALVSLFLKKRRS